MADDQNTEGTAEIETPEQGDAADDEHQDDDGQTYPAKVVKDLRKENASYRERARTAEARVDELARQLFTLRVQATGKLQDPSDLEYDPDLLSDNSKLEAAIDDLLSRKPHLAARKVSGSVGQGERGHKETAPQDFSALLRG